jgi:hypothetical protein
MNHNSLLKRFNLDEIWGVDFETFWDRKNKYSLTNMANTEYIFDDRFEMQLAAIQRHSWSRAKVLTGPQFIQWARTINWQRAGFLAHHAHFDGLIASHYAGVKPAVYFDTLSMARPVMPVTVPRGLDSLSRALGGRGKVHGGALTNVEGLRLKQFSKPQLTHLKTYAGDDIEETWYIFNKLVDFIPHDELRLINTTVRMYAQPLVLLDRERLEALHCEILERKQKYFDDLGITRQMLMSNEQFAKLLEDLGVDPPTKISPRTNRETFAFSKSDIDFKALLEHDDDRVVSLVEARLDVKSTSVETRASRLALRSAFGPQPIYYNYWGAGPGRWSGGDKANWQNLKRGSALRTAVCAPDGYEFIIADLAQIEARLNAWFAGQQDVLQVFRDYDVILGFDAKGEPIRGGPDVYKVAAALIYSKPVDQVTKDERFIGKVAVLGLGYGAGWQTFAKLLRLGSMGPAVNISDSDAMIAHKKWRMANAYIVANWKRTHNLMKQAFSMATVVEDGCVAYEGVRAGKKLNGFMHLPGGMSIRYDDVQFDAEGGMDYTKIFRQRKTKEPLILRGRLYGGLEVENRTQGLARKVVADHALRIEDALGKRWRLALTTHDELVGLVPKRSASVALKVVQKVMSTPPSWAPDLPLAVDAHRSVRYDK